MKFIFKLDIFYEDEDLIEHYTPIGMFSSLAKAESAIKTLQSTPAFKNEPTDHFFIEKWLIDEFHSWEEGFC